MEQKERIWKKGRNTKMFLALLFAAILLASIVPAASADGWNCRRAINITNSGDALTDYQVLVTLNTNNFDYSKANDDGSDLRFTNYENSTAYHYWIETWNPSGESKIWVHVSSIPAGDSKMYMWYDNSAASIESNGDVTFDFFDDFEGTSLDTEKWTKRGDGSLEVSGSVIHTKSQKAIYGKSNINDIFDKCIEIRGKLKGCMDTDVEVGFGTMTGGNLWHPERYGVWISVMAYLDRAVMINNDGGKGPDCGADASGELWDYSDYKNYRLKFESNRGRVWKEGTSVFDRTAPCSQTNSNLPVLIVFDHRSGNDYDEYVDWVFVRKYADPEPTTSVSATEEDVTGPVEPVPELPTIILFSVGLLVLAGYAVFRRQKG